MINFSFGPESPNSFANPEPRNATIFVYCNRSISINLSKQLITRYYDFLREYYRMYFNWLDECERKSCVLLKIYAIFFNGHILPMIPVPGGVAQFLEGLPTEQCSVREFITSINNCESSDCIFVIDNYDFIRNINDCAKS